MLSRTAIALMTLLGFWPEVASADNWVKIVCVIQACRTDEDCHTNTERFTFNLTTMFVWTENSRKYPVTGTETALTWGDDDVSYSLDRTTFRIAGIDTFGFLYGTFRGNGQCQRDQPQM